MKFEVGELVVYPALGVGVIERIEEKRIYDSPMLFYIIRILSNNTTVMVPTQNAEGIGLRQVTPSENIPRIYEILSEKKRRKRNESMTWNRRYKAYMDKIKTGSVFEVAEVLRDLSLLKTTKDLSFGERKVLDTARNLLVKELSIAQNTDEA
ncbi:MAG: CarD family transcriptional regulator, partial [Deltaproteobacteria bacterium]